MRKNSVTRFAAAVVVAMGLGPAARVDASTAVGSGLLRGFNGVQVVGLPDFACTSSTPFVDMPGMTLRFNLEVPGSIVVLFQGQFGGFSSTADARAALRLTVDGAIVGSAIAIGNDVGTGLETFGFNAFSQPLAAGLHVVRAQWHTFPAGATTCVEERSLIVLRP